MEGATDKLYNGVKNALTGKCKSMLKATNEEFNTILNLKTVPPQTRAAAFTAALNGIDPLRVPDIGVLDLPSMMLPTTHEQLKDIRPKLVVAMAAFKAVPNNGGIKSQDKEIKLYLFRV